MASLLGRVGSQAVRRLSWGVADQAVSSLTNYAVVLYIARSLGAEQFGAFSLAYVTYGFALNASRGLSTDSLLVRFSGTDVRTWRRAVASCTGTATLVGLGTGTCALVAAALLHGTAKLGFFALGLTLPGLLLQDSWRYSFFAHGRGSQALLNDMVWGLALLPALALVQITHHVDVFWCVFAWGAAAGVAAAVGPLQARLVPRLSQAQGWMSRHRDLGFRYLAENTTQSASVQLRAYGVGFVLGLAAVGYVQAASTLMGPFMVIFFGLGLVTVPEAARVLRRSQRQLPRFCLLVGAGLAAAAFMWGAALLVALPRGLGDLLLGPKLWRPTYPLILPLTISLMGGCVSAGAGTGLHALAAARRSLRATLIAAASLVVCALVGADAAGAVGTMWGSAVAGWIGALLFWWQLRAALKESGRVRGRRRARRNRHPDRSRPSGQPEQSAAARSSARTAVVRDIDATWGTFPPADELARAPGRPSVEPVEVLARGRLPRVAELDPYTLGATHSAYGSAVTYGHRDGYVQRTADAQLADALRPSRLVILVGPPKAGKTRTAFEVVRSSNAWRDGLLAAPSPGSLAELAEHPGLSGSSPLVVWLDNLPRFLPPAGDLSQATISRLLDRPGPTVLLATLCGGQRGPLRGTWAGLTDDVRTVLNHATVIELKSTREDPAEQELSSAIYPQVASGPEGLGEVLAGAPELLSRYRDSATTDPILYALVRTCVDWARCGFARPIPEPDLLATVGDTLAGDHPGPGQHDGEPEDALRRACQPLSTAVPALLRCHQLQDQTRAYDAFDYLIVADDGQGGRARPLTEATWRRLLSRATSQDAFGISVAAYLRDNKPVAVRVSRHAAEAEFPDAQYGLGLLLADQVNPPDLAEARTWWTRAAEAGHTDAQYALRRLLASLLDPPDLAGARTWWTRAAEAGHGDAQFNLGVLLADLQDPPALTEARAWYTRAAEAGDTDAQFNLGLLLANRLDPPDLDGARAWWTRAAEAGDGDARFNLGVLLANLQNPADLAEARGSYTQAAEAGVSRTPVQPQAPDGHQTVAAGARLNPNQVDAGT